MAGVARSERHGFTLVEIMVVVAVIGLLATLALPSFMRARYDSHVRRAANDLRVLEAGFIQYAMDSGSYPVNQVGPCELPPGLDSYIDLDKWRLASPAGGDFQYITASNSPFSAPSIAIVSNPDLDIMAEVDVLMDDGKSASGFLRQSSSNYYLIMQE